MNAGFMKFRRTLRFAALGGVTLVEVLIVVAIMAVISGMGVTLVAALFSDIDQRSPSSGLPGGGERRRALHQPRRHERRLPDDAGLIQPEEAGREEALTILGAALRHRLHRRSTSSGRNDRKIGTSSTTSATTSSPPTSNG